MTEGTAIETMLRLALCLAVCGVAVLNGFGTERKKAIIIIA